MTEIKNEKTSITVKRDTLAELAKKRISEGWGSYDKMLKEELIR